MLFLLASPCFGQDYFDWAVRTDRDGMPAGRYETTPFPITETTTSCVVRNDEHPDGITFELGSLHFVDGAAGAGGDGSWALPWATIAEAIGAVPAGNATIVVRGAHDGFDGVYPETGLTLKSGVDDTHRWTLAGYGQERPVIEGGSKTDSVVVASGAVTYATVQRLRIQDNFLNGVRTAPDDAFINVIDVWLYNNCRWDPEKVNEDGSLGGTLGDGNLYFLGSDDSWIFHSTAERSDGHGFKVGDDADRNLVEWSVAMEAGWWEGTPVTDRSHAGQGHPTACDFPNDGVDSDGDTVPDYGDGLVIRYNICGPSLFPAVQLRRTPDFVFHHNEVVGSPRFGEVYVDNRNAGIEQVIILGDRTWGIFYANLIRSPGSGKAEPLYTAEEGLGGVTAVSISGNAGAEGDITMWSNLIYGHDEEPSIDIGYSEEGYSNISLYNNSIASALSSLDWGVGVVHVNTSFWNFESSFSFVNNIIHLAGAGRCTEWHGHEGDILHDDNVYHHPSGELGFDAASLAAGESEADPLWEALPAGEYAPSFAALTEGSPARDTGSDLGAAFAAAFNNVARPQGSGWDIGAVEYAVALPDEGAETVEPADTVETDAEGGDAAPEADAEASQDAVSDPDAEPEEPDGGGGEGCGCRLAA
jgi:hypothetical protein